MQSVMDRILRKNLAACFQAFTNASGLSQATVSARVAGDWRFFDRLDDCSRTFTIRKYEAIVNWFATHWPENAEWPATVPHPSEDHFAK